ncbi:hypothetical protein SAMN05421823_109113 [Catalinimonas alkaloidigena]|uniref:Uncharacterized protein n=1 Tax=Catalinimonas alkaloidigena TaxID=1075417 RepID=A0A1G9PA13_9BACT|nr:hypothetical protein [Catalinimonas alkaloidigena]SDL94995.1 hypothetical protein SAMN05421823_109113 [Catalinimonas alkaloidigena]
MNSLRKRYVFLLGLLCSSCIRYGGARSTLDEPSRRTAYPGEILQYARTHHIGDSSEFLIFDPTALDTLGRRPFKPTYELDYQPLLQFKVFGKDGRMLSHYGSIEGDLTDEVLARVPPHNLSPIYGQYFLEEELAQYRTWEGQPVAFAQLPEADYYVVVWWSVRGGVTSARLQERMARYVAEHPRHKWVLLNVNTDIIYDESKPPPPADYNPNPYR